jgi:hypothetical protein
MYLRFGLKTIQINNPIIQLLINHW